MRFADDTVLIADNVEGLQTLLQRLNNTCRVYGLKMNLKKTKFMIITKREDIQVNVLIDDTTMERVQKYKYLGSWLTENLDQSAEIKARIEIARASFVKLKKCLCSGDINLKLRLRMLRGYIFATLLYGSEAWTLKKAEMEKLEAFERWCYRRMLRIAWTDKVTNVELRRRIQKDEEVINTLKKRKLEYFGHIMRGPKYALLQNIIEGKIKGRRSQGRRRTSWLKNLREWFGMTSNQLFRAAVNKVRIAMMISNLH